MSDIQQSPGMTLGGSNLSFGAFATADAGSEYLATTEHYESLARGIVDALRRSRIVLVTGAPPASPPMLGAALRTAVEPRAVIELPCSPDLNLKKLFGSGSASPDASAPVTIGQAGPSERSSPIVLFADADRLTDDQIREFYEAAQAIPTGPDALEAGVLLARSAFDTRFEGPEFHFFEKGLAARLRVQQLERDEVEAFICHQLPSGEGANLFTAQRVALIALASGGNPAVVNRLARRMLEIEPDVSAGGLPAKLLQAWRRYVRISSGNKSTAKPVANTAGGKIAPTRLMPRRYPVSLRLPAGIIICLGAALWGAGAFQQPDLGAFIGLVREHILPRNEASEASAGAAAAPSPVAAMGSSSVSAAAAVPPNAASADVAMREPVAPGATPSPGSAPEPAPLPVADGPRNDASEAPAGAGAARSPVAAMGSSSVGKAAVPPSVASAGKTMPEPAATSADHPGAAPSPESLPEPAPQPVTDGPRLSASEIAALMVRGDAFLAAGDIASARLFFERAVDSGDGRAAMRMAVTYDAAFLERAGLRGRRGDPERATFWSRRAHELGEGKAGPPLGRLGTSGSAEPLLQPR